MIQVAGVLAIGLALYTVGWMQGLQQQQFPWVPGPTPGAFTNVFFLDEGQGEKPVVFRIDSTGKAVPHSTCSM
jgi:hypothetical protein